MSAENSKAESIKPDETQKVCSTNCLDFLNLPNELKSLVKSYFKKRYCLFKTLYTHNLGDYHYRAQYAHYDNQNCYIYLEYDCNNNLKICNLAKRATQEYNEKLHLLFSSFGASRAIKFNFNNFKFSSMKDMINKNYEDIEVKYDKNRFAAIKAFSNILGDELKNIGKKNWEFLKQELQIEEQENSVFFYAISPDQKYVAVSHFNGNINVWRLNDNENVMDIIIPSKNHSVIRN